MNAVTIFQDASANTELAPEFHAMVEAGTGLDDLGAGIGGNYAILSIRGGKFRVKYQGEETPILDDKGDPVGSLEAVLVRANPYLTKQFYEKGYEEGDNAAPSCFSIDGKMPAASVESPQHTNCAMCPQNKFGSRVTPAGVSVKACQDNKKLAIVPLADLENKAVGGPMLFRVPASALKGLLTFNSQMTARNYPYNAVAVRIGLDIDVSYPKPTFRAIRVLTSEEARTIIAHYESDAVERLLGDFSEVHAPAPAATDSAFEQEPDPQPKPAPAAAKPNPPVIKTQPAAAKPVPIKTAAMPPVANVQPKAPAAAAKPAAAKPAPPAPPPARKPAVVAKPAPVVVAEPEAAAEPEGEAIEAPTGMEQSIADILSELNAVAE